MKPMTAQDSDRAIWILATELGFNCTWVFGKYFFATNLTPFLAHANDKIVQQKINLAQTSHLEHAQTIETQRTVGLKLFVAVSLRIFSADRALASRARSNSTNLASFAISSYSGHGGNSVPT